MMQKMPDCITVLLVEDSRGEAILTESKLCGNDAGRFAITLARNFAQAKQLLAQKNFEIILLDLNLPDANGPESLSYFQKNQPDVPIIILSAEHDEVAVLRSLSYGATAYLSKMNTTAEQLRSAIFNAIFRKSLKAKQQPV